MATVPSAAERDGAGQSDANVRDERRAAGLEGGDGARLRGRVDLAFEKALADALAKSSGSGGAAQRENDRNDFSAGCAPPGFLPDSSWAPGWRSR